MFTLPVPRSTTATRPTCPPPTSIPAGCVWLLGLSGIRRRRAVGPASSQARVDGDGSSGNRRRLVGGQEDGQFGDLGWLDQASERDARQPVPQVRDSTVGHS